jgi:hypothetical protein
MQDFPRSKSFALKLIAALSLASVGVPALAGPTTILFVGNSYTYGQPAGALGPNAMTFRPGTVTDLNGTGIGGVPALFKAFTQEAGLDYEVSLETVGGKGLDYHYNEKLSVINKPFDKVVLQSYSTLDANRPGNPDLLIKYSGLLAQSLHEQNSDVDIYLDATWSRADLTYKTDSPWKGASIYQMGLDVRAGYDEAAQASALINGVIPVGDAWNRAIRDGVADANPYDGIEAGKLNLWAPDNYHASVQGYYLEALTMYGSITGLDPRSLGISDSVARDLGISASQAAALQTIASNQLVSEVPEPGTMMMFSFAGCLMWLVSRRKRST